MPAETAAFFFGTAGVIGLFPIWGIMLANAIEKDNPPDGSWVLHTALGTLIYWAFFIALIDFGVIIGLANSGGDIARFSNNISWLPQVVMLLVGGNVLGGIASKFKPDWGDTKLEFFFLCLLCDVLIVILYGVTQIH